MGESNQDWGFLATDEQREAWDSYGRIPEPGQNQPLDSFLVGKRLDHSALVRIGARLSGPTVLAFAYEGGIKYRDVVTGSRWSFHESTFRQLKIIPGIDRDAAFIVEGETDAMRVSMLYPCDVAVMPAGAEAWLDEYTPQVSGYERIYVGLDNDKAGEGGFRKIKRVLQHAVRVRPPEGANDWCDVDPDTMPLPDLPLEVAGPSTILVSARELLTLAVPDVPSWFADAVLPVGGSAVIHGTFKSFKTWMSLAMASALAQGEPWALFESAEEPARVAYLNFEVPWAYYQQRVTHFADAAKRRDLFLDNYLGYMPLTRPKLIAGRPESEDAMIKVLVEGQVQIVFIDAVRRALGFANPNAEEEVRRLLHFVERLNDEGMTVVMVHHDNKDSDRHGGGDPAGMTGSGAWAGDVDSIISIERPREVKRDEAKRNVKFLLRNAPSPSPVGFELTEDAKVLWHPETWVEGEDPDDPTRPDI